MMMQTCKHMHELGAVCFAVCSTVVAFQQQPGHSQHRQQVAIVAHASELAAALALLAPIAYHVMKTREAANAAQNIATSTCAL